MSPPSPRSMAMLVSWSGCTLIGKLAVIDGPWVNPRHGRRPRYQVTALAKRGTNVVALMNTEYKIQFLVVNPHGNIILGFSKGI